MQYAELSLEVQCSAQRPHVYIPIYEMLHTIHTSMYSLWGTIWDRGCMRRRGALNNCNTHHHQTTDTLQPPSWQCPTWERVSGPRARSKCLSWWPAAAQWQVRDWVDWAYWALPTTWCT